MRKACKPSKRVRRIPRVARVKRAKAADGTTYPTPEPLPFTPGYDKLVPGLHCQLIVCNHSIDMHNTGISCKIIACYKRLILIGVGRHYRDRYLVSPIFLAKLRCDGTVPNSFYHRLVMGLLSSVKELPKKLQSYIRKENTMGRGDRRTKKKAKKKRRTPAERKAKAKRISSKKSTGKPKKKRVSISSVMYAYFDQVGLKNITYKRALRIALKVKPDTKFNKTHFSWYRNQYRKKKGIK